VLRFPDEATDVMPKAGAIKEEEDFIEGIVKDLKDLAEVATLSSRTMMSWKPI
jgi:hypothetical protein